MKATSFVYIIVKLTPNDLGILCLVCNQLVFHKVNEYVLFAIASCDLGG